MDTESPTQNSGIDPKPPRGRVRNCFRIAGGDRPLTDLHRLLKAIGRGVYVLVNHRAGQSLFVHSSQALEQILEVTGSPVDSTAVEPQAVFYFNVEGVTSPAAAALIQDILVTSPGSLVNGAYMDIESSTLVVFTDRPVPSATPTLALALVLDVDFATIDGLGEVDGGVLFGLSAIEAEDEHLVLVHAQLEKVPGVVQAVISAEESTIWVSVEDEGEHHVDEVREGIRQAVLACGYRVVDHHDRIYMFQKPFAGFIEASGVCDVTAAQGESPAWAKQKVDAALLAPISTRATTTSAVIHSLEKLGYRAEVKGSRALRFEIGKVKCNYCIRRLKVELEALHKFLHCHMLLTGTAFYVRLGEHNEEAAVQAVRKALVAIGVPPDTVKYAPASFPTGADTRTRNHDAHELVNLRLNGRKDKAAPPSAAFPTLKLRVPGLTCPVCAVLVEAHLLREPRVVQAVIQVAPSAASAFVQLHVSADRSNTGMDVINVMQKFRSLGYPAEQERADPHQNSALLMQAFLKRDKIQNYREVVTVTKEFEPDDHTLRSMFPFLRPRCTIIEAHHYSEPPEASTDVLPSESPELYRCSSSSRSFVHMSTQRMLVRKKQPKQSPRKRQTWTDTSTDTESEFSGGGLRPGVSRAAKETVQLSLFGSREDPEPQSDSGSESFATPPVGPMPPPTDFHLVVKDQPDDEGTEPPQPAGAHLYYFESAWTFWFDVTVDVKAEHRTKEDVQAMLQNLGSFSTIQGFWSYWNNLNVTKLRDGCNLKLFKKGVRPMWEDEANNQGGRWMARSIPKEQRFKIWSNIVFAMIGEQLPSDGTEICGVVLSTKTSGDVIELWVNQCSSANRTVNPLAAALRCIAFPDNERKSFYFRPHAVYEAYKRNHRGGRRKHKTSATASRAVGYNSGSSGEGQPPAKPPTHQHHHAHHEALHYQCRQPSEQRAPTLQELYQQQHKLQEQLRQQQQQTTPQQKRQVAPTRANQSTLTSQVQAQFTHQHVQQQQAQIQGLNIQLLGQQLGFPAAFSPPFVPDPVALYAAPAASTAQALLTQDWRNRLSEMLPDGVPPFQLSIQSRDQSTSESGSHEAPSRETSKISDTETGLLAHQLQVKQWLDSHHVGEYFQVFLSNGYDDMEAVYDLDEPELDFMGVKRGHKKRILQAIGKQAKGDAPSQPVQPQPFLANALQQWPQQGEQQRLGCAEEAAWHQALGEIAARGR